MTCGIVLPDGRTCGEPVETGAPLDLCTRHLLEAHDWVARRVGTTDLLPSPCLACGSRIGVRYPSGWVCAECEWRVGEVPGAPGAVIGSYALSNDVLAPVLGVEEYRFAPGSTGDGVAWPAGVRRVA